MKGFKRLLDVGAAACVAAGLLLLMASGASAARRTCLVVNVRSGQSFRTLQEATDAAFAGDELTVKGTCRGDTQIGKSLTVVGQSNSGFGSATLEGDNTGGAVVLACRTFGPPSLRCPDLGGKVEVTLSGLQIVGLVESVLSGVTLNHSTVTGSIGDGHGGVTVNNSTVIGGIGAYEGAILLNNSTVRGRTKVEGGTFEETGCSPVINGRGQGGGIWSVDYGSLTLNHSTVTGSSAELGGGIFNGFFASATLNDSTVTGNSAELGGGIYNVFGSVTLNNSTVTENSAEQGGGIYSVDAGVTLNDSNVSNNAATVGGGIDNRGGLTLNGSSSVSRNTASGTGGGIYNNQTCGATINYGTDWTGTVSGNTPDDIFNF